MTTIEPSSRRAPYGALLIGWMERDGEYALPELAPRPMRERYSHIQQAMEAQVPQTTVADVARDLDASL